MVKYFSVKRVYSRVSFVSSHPHCVKDFLNRARICFGQGKRVFKLIMSLSLHHAFMLYFTSHSKNDRNRDQYPL